MTPPDSPKARILVVDDEDPILSVFKQILIPSAQPQRPVASKSGTQRTTVAPVFEIVCCRQGPEAADHVKDSLADGNPFSVVFLDLLMPPGPSGVETARMIRQIDPDIEIVLVTGKLDVNPVEIAQEIPPEYKLLYLRKPFHAQEILQMAYGLSLKWQMETENRRLKQHLEREIEARTESLLFTNQQLREEIKERKQLWNELFRSEEKYRNILETIEDGYFETDLRGDLTFFNNSLSRILGYGYEELVGLNHRNYTEPKTVLKTKPFFKRILKTGKPTRIADYEIFVKDGSKKILELSTGPLIDRKGHTTGFRGLARDVTQRVHNKNTLRESEERYRNFFAATQEGICFHDSGAVIDINDRFSQLFGFEHRAIIGSNLAELIINQKDQDWVARKMAAKAPGPFRVIVHRKDDSTFLAEIQSRPATLLGRKLQAASIRDISNH